MRAFLYTSQGRPPAWMKNLATGLLFILLFVFLEEDPSLVERAASTSESSPVHEAVEVMEFEAGEMDFLKSDEMAEFMEFEFLLDVVSEIVKTHYPIIFISVPLRFLNL